MLLRLQVSGFKNLVDVDVRFGPFTCIAGSNGVGKSNLIDVIQLIGALADKPFLDALMGLRAEGRGETPLHSFFFKAGELLSDTITLVVDLLIPAQGQDPFGNTLKARATLLRYTLTLRRQSSIKLTIGHEELRSLTPTEGRDALTAYGTLMDLADKHPAESVIFLITGADDVLQLLLEDTYHSVRRLGPSEHLKSTLLTQVEPLLFPTAYLAREELRSWRAFHLEPTALRTIDRLSESETRLASNGEHMAATLNALLEASGSDDAQADIKQGIATQLGQLIGNVREVKLYPDPTSNTLVLYVKDRAETEHNVRALSDGTLRFLAMAILAHDPRPGVFCIEEPENGLHPERIAVILDLLQTIAFDPQYPIDEMNSLRQIIITTHSPIVVSQVPDGSLLYGELVRRRKEKKLVQVATFRWLKETWRAAITQDSRMTVARGNMFSYIAPMTVTQVTNTERLVPQNPDIQAMFK